MIRGRHRGLPVALDRAVLLPHEFKKHESDTNEAQGQPAEDSFVSTEKHQQPDAASIAPEKDEMVEGPSNPVSHRTRTLSFADPPTYGSRSADLRVDNSGMDTTQHRIHDINETSPV